MEPNWLNDRTFQLNCVKRGLDVSAVYVLYCFCEYCASQSAETMVAISNTTRNRETFYNVKYQEYIDDMGQLLGVTEKKAMASRFTKLCNAGILEKIEKKTREGTFIYFRVNKDGYHALFNAFDETTQDNKSQCASENNEKATSAEDEIVSSALDNLCQSFKSTTNSCSKFKNITTTTYYSLVAEQLSELWGTVDVFSAGFCSDLALFCMNQKLPDTDVKGFVSFLYERTILKAKRDPYGYFFKIAMNPSYISQYKHMLKIKQKTEKVQKTVSCPACNKAVKPYSNCENCGLMYTDFKNIDAIAVHKKKTELPLERQKEYQKRYDLLYQKYNEYAERKKKVEELNKEYGLIN